MMENPQIQKFIVTEEKRNKALTNRICVFLAYLGLFALCIGYAIFGKNFLMVYKIFNLNLGAFQQWVPLRQL